MNEIDRELDRIFDHYNDEIPTDMPMCEMDEETRLSMVRDIEHMERGW